MSVSGSGAEQVMGGTGALYPHAAQLGAEGVEDAFLVRQTGFMPPAVDGSTVDWANQDTWPTLGPAVREDGTVIEGDGEGQPQFAATHLDRRSDETAVGQTVGLGSLVFPPTLADARKGKTDADTNFLSGMPVTFHTRAGQNTIRSSMWDADGPKFAGRLAATTEGVAGLAALTGGVVATEAAIGGAGGAANAAAGLFGGSFSALEGFSWASGLADGLGLTAIAGGAALLGGAVHHATEKMKSERLRPLVRWAVGAVAVAAVGIVTFAATGGNVVWAAANATATAAGYGFGNHLDERNKRVQYRSRVWSDAHGKHADEDAIKTDFVDQMLKSPWEATTIDHDGSTAWQQRHPKAHARTVARREAKQQAAERRGSRGKKAPAAVGAVATGPVRAIESSSGDSDQQVMQGVGEES